MFIGAGDSLNHIRDLIGTGRSGDLELCPDQGVGLFIELDAARVGEDIIYPAFIGEPVSHRSAEHEAGKNLLLVIILIVIGEDQLEPVGIIVERAVEGTEHLAGAEIIDVLEFFALPYLVGHAVGDDENAVFRLCKRGGHRERRDEQRQNEQRGYQFLHRITS